MAKKYFLKLTTLLFVAVLVFLNFAPSVLANDELPEPLVGQTIVRFTESGTDQVLYGGLGGNEVILNFDLQEEDLGFQINPMRNCASLPALTSIVQCFILNTTRLPFLIMSGKSYINGVSTTDVAALLYNPNIIQGDAYSSFDSGNFAFYGRNLNQTHDNTNSPSNGSWNVQNYSFNSEAQSSYSAAQTAYLKSRVFALASEAQKVTSASLGSFSEWKLQESSILGGANESSKYPEGKVWLVTGCDGGPTSVKSCLKLTNNVTYSGKGTLIFLGDGASFVEMTAGRSIKPATKNDSLGIIIAGQSSGVIDSSASLDFKGNNVLQAGVLTFGTLGRSGVGSIEAIGSFVAESFQGFDNNNFSRFVYDYKLEQNWPPGFRYFNMPHAENSSPN